jgi:alkaline phosphatase D
MNLQDRRGWLRLAAASAATLWLPRSAWSQPKIGTNPFTLGVASGSPTHDSVVLWTRLHALPGLPGEGIGQAPVTVRYEVAHDEAFTRIVQRGQVQALPQLAHAVHAEVQGLESDRWYHYRFLVGGTGNDWVSTTGRTRTLARPQAQAARLRLAYASCQRWEHGYFSAWRHMLQEDLDCVLFLGDYIYEYPNTPNPVRLPTGGWLHTLDDYRQRYALYKGEPELQAMHAACPWIMTWDDHEVQNDYAALVAGNAGPQVPDFAARRAAAYQAYYEHMPLPARALTQAFEGLARGVEMRIYGSVAHGRLARVYLLDDRQYRDPQLCNKDGRLGSSTLDPETCAAWNDPRRTLLGAAQEQWLDQALASQAVPEGWNIIAQQSLYGRRDNKPGFGALLWNDGWDGYAPARGRLSASLQKHQVANPVFLGGDVHENWVGHVLADYDRPDSAKIGVEFCGTSLTSRSAGNARTPERLAENPHFVFADAQRKGYGVAEFTPRRLTTQLRVVDDVTQRDTKIETLASFAVEAGRALVERG